MEHAKLTETHIQSSLKLDSDIQQSKHCSKPQVIGTTKTKCDWHNKNMSEDMDTKTIKK